MPYDGPDPYQGEDYGTQAPHSFVPQRPVQSKPSQDELYDPFEIEAEMSQHDVDQRSTEGLMESFGGSPMKFPSSSAAKNDLQVSVVFLMFIYFQTRYLE